MIFNPNEHSIVFLSYDEPNCEVNYQHLRELCPNVLRVHGIRGSDTAHKRVAEISKTQNVIIIDADNFVNRHFFTDTIIVPDQYNKNTNVLSFSSYNTINGNCYGNGGIKVWPVELLKSMKTHENGTGVDFDLSNYIELDYVASEIHFGSGYQAWRAGFREGVKLLLENDKLVPFKDIDYRNFDRLWLWSHVGTDVKYGEYSIYGCRQAVYFMLNHKFNHHEIIDFKHIEDYYTGKIKDSNRLFYLVRVVTDNWFFGDVLDQETSKKIREAYINPSRIKQNDDEFMIWADSFRTCAKNFDENKSIKLCTTGRDLPHSEKRMNGAKLGLEYYKEHRHNYKKLSLIYDYEFLKELYDEIYSYSL